MASVEIKLDKSDRIYKPGDIVKGIVSVQTPIAFPHGGIQVTAAGTVMIQVNTRGGVLEALQGSPKPICLMRKVMDLQPPGKLPAGTTQLAFEFVVEQDSASEKGHPLYETYHGAYISIQYLISADMPRGMLQKGLTAGTEFMIEIPHAGRPPRSLGSSVSFIMTPDSQKHALAPAIQAGGFRISGRLATVCQVAAPLEGEVVVEHAGVAVQAIEVQLRRVEQLTGDASRGVPETTELQTTQIADGDICRGLALPVHIILPRLFTCPNIVTLAFSLEFEVSIVVFFEGSNRSKRLSQANPDASLQTIAFETLPLRLVRT